MMPPFKTPGNASYFFSGCHSATTSSPLGKLRICKPSGLAGPQPKQAFRGAYFSWSEISFTMVDRAVPCSMLDFFRRPTRVELTSPGGAADPAILQPRRSRGRPDTFAVAARYKVSAAESIGCDRVVRRRVRTSRPRAMRQRVACLAPAETRAS